MLSTVRIALSAVKKDLVTIFKSRLLPRRPRTASGLVLGLQCDILLVIGTFCLLLHNEMETLALGALHSCCSFLKELMERSRFHAAQLWVPITRRSRLVRMGQEKQVEVAPGYHYFANGGYQPRSWKAASAYNEDRPQENASAHLCQMFESTKRKLFLLRLRKPGIWIESAAISVEIWLTMWFIAWRVKCNITWIGELRAALWFIWSLWFL